MFKSPLLIITFLFLLNSCSNHTEESSQNTATLSNTSKSGESANAKIKNNSTKLAVSPSKYFLDIVSIFDSAAFRPDTNRLKLPEYYSKPIASNPIYMVNQIPFYTMDTLTNPVFYFIHHGLPKGHSSQVDSIIATEHLRKACAKVETISGFYFTKKKSSSPTTDGFIEEWVFASATNAKAAELALTEAKISSPAYYFIYFNSFTHVFRKDKYLYIFYSRANWDTKQLEDLYHAILNKIKPETWTNYKGKTLRKTANAVV